jgi:hypothetical protein
MIWINKDGKTLEQVSSTKTSQVNDKLINPNKPLI